jgi:hypothetical protein
VCIVIQEIFPDSVVAKDGRLMPGDQILEVRKNQICFVPFPQMVEYLIRCMHANTRGADLYTSLTSTNLWQEAARSYGLFQTFIVIVFSSKY